MANQSKLLYDSNQQPFDPKTDAVHVHSGVMDNSYSLKLDLDAIVALIRNVQSMASGADQVKGTLGITISYATTNSSDSPKDALGITWSEDMHTPSPSAQYAWKRTQYTWNTKLDNGSILPTDLLTTYEIVATALYPETQLMFAAVGNDAYNQEGNLALEGPSDYVDNAQDQAVTGVRWFKYLPNLGGAVPEGYMAVRHREAGGEFPMSGNKKLWGIGLIGRYINA